MITDGRVIEAINEFSIVAVEGRGGSELYEVGMGGRFDGPAWEEGKVKDGPGDGSI